MPSVQASESADVRQQPLYGLRVLVTRPEDQAADFIERLHRLGAVPVLCPTIQTVPPDDYRPLDMALADLAAFDWLILTSANGVRHMFQRMEFLQRSVTLPDGLRVAAIGPATADVLVAQGLAVDFMPRRHIAEALVEEIGDVEGARVLLPLADIARPTLADGLRQRSADVTVVTAYRTITVDRTTFANWFVDAPAFDVATFTSSSTVRNFVGLAGEARAQVILGSSIVACIGPITAQTARECGLRVDVVSEEHTTDGLLRSVVAYFQTDKDRV